ncbi:hypothetical protein ABES02_29260 [Neobacillus pocheonensis]|uniref:hypothetical protein n=1 Tax=Neobacillus pocheonensis TaxID=363869 RepID=UPI003D2D0D88
MFGFIRRILPLAEITTDDYLLLYESRDFLHSLVTENSHRISRWNKSLENGSIFFWIDEQGLHYEISSSMRIKMFEFHLTPPYKEVHFMAKIKNGADYKPVTLIQDKVIDEIKDLMQLCYFVDLVNTSNIGMQALRNGPFPELIEKMDWEYAFKYRDFAEKLIDRASKAKI